MPFCHKCGGGYEGEDQFCPECGSPTVESKSPTKGPSSDAFISLKREKFFSDSLRDYQIILDGKSISKISNGEEITIEVPAGKHKMHMKIDWTRSRTVAFDVAKKETMQLVCGPNVRGWKTLLALLYITIWRKDYLYLRVREKR